MSKLRRSQGEIFGVALMFVVIIVGFLLFAKYKSLNPDNPLDSITEEKYKILAESTLNTILELETKCQVERDKNSIKDLIVYCIENTRSYGDDPSIDCSGDNLQSCSYAINLLNLLLNNIFNTKGNGIGPIPYKLKINPSFRLATNSLKTNLTNFGSFEYKDQIIDESNYAKKGFRRAPSGPRDIATSNRNINFELYLYYR